MAEERTYYIRVQGQLVEVDNETYHIYYSIEHHRKTLDEKDVRNGRVLYNALDTKGTSGEGMLTDQAILSVEEIVTARLMYERLHQCMSLLPKEERKLIHALYFEGISEHQLSKRTGIPRMTIHDRKEKTLRKLRKLIEK